MKKVLSTWLQRDLWDIYIYGKGRPIFWVIQLIVHYVNCPGPCWENGWIHENRLCQFLYPFNEWNTLRSFPVIFHEEWVSHRTKTWSGKWSWVTCEGVYVVSVQSQKKQKSAFEIKTFKKNAVISVRPRKSHQCGHLNMTWTKITTPS